MVILFVRMKVRPEKRRELSQTFHSIVEHVRMESGCRYSGFYQDLENEDNLLVVEEWTTEKDWDDHLQSDIFAVLLGAGTLMHRPPEIVIHKVDQSKELET